MIRVLIADDHPLVRQGLKYLLSSCADIEFSGEVANGAELIAAMRENSYDVVLLDLYMPGRNGIELIKQMKSEYPNVPIIVLSTHKEDMFALRTLKAGASGYLCKDYAGANLVDAIRKVSSGGCFISPAVSELMAKDLHSPIKDLTPHSLLSDREYQIFMLIASGLGPSEIADKLNLSVKTVSTHKTRIKDKMKFSNTSEIVRYALKHGLIEQE